MASAIVTAQIEIYMVGPMIGSPLNRLWGFGSAGGYKGGDQTSYERNCASFAMSAGNRADRVRSTKATEP